MRRGTGSKVTGDNDHQGQNGAEFATVEAYKQPKEKLFEIYQSSPDGLKQRQANKRQEKIGKNVIEKGKSVSPLKLFLRQFKSFLVIILILAAIISFSIGLIPGQEPHNVDALLIITILIANGVFGFIQDYKAEKSIEALRKLASPSTSVLRDGEKREVGVEELVPGDVVLLDQGDSVPADARILLASNLETDESTLTGESLPVSKSDQVIEGETSLAERNNMIYKGTNVTKGHVKALVVATGMQTEMGKIASGIRQAGRKKTPFQQEVDSLGKKIGIGILAIIVIVALVELGLNSSSPLTIFLTAISLAVAAVPEGLPAIVTLSLALGSKRMVSRNALVRKLPVVESLGSVDTICTDKTGTLTTGKMTVSQIFFDGQSYQVTGKGYSLQGKFLLSGEEIDQQQLAKILICGVQCNNSEKTSSGYEGDPTEIALLISGKKGGWGSRELKKENERVSEISFTAKRKMMSTIHQDGTLYSKGAPATILNRCDRVWEDGRVKQLTEDKRERIRQKNEEMAGDALRVLAFAYKDIGDPEKVDKEDDNLEQNLVFLGLQGMLDPARREVKEAIKDCRSAGINVIMVTGDNKTTAKAIGGKLGFNAETAVEGKELEAMGEEELRDCVNDIEIFARVSPSHKVKILQALQDEGHIVAMTGDGVNDAPALKNSDVGISMGERGTDVAEESSEMVLLDDNFKTIRDAVAEGRGIFDNIRKFVNYLLSANAGEVLVVFLASIVGLGLPLTAIMLLWINLLTDGLPALALGLDPKSKGIMDRQPRKKSEGVINKMMTYSIVSIGLSMGLIILILFNYFHSQPVRAQTVAFTSLVIFEMVRIQAIRSRYRIPALSNKWLWMAIASSVLLQLGVLYSPLNAFFGVVPLGFFPWLMIIGGLVAFAVFTWVIVRIGDHIFG